VTAVGGLEAGAVRPTRRRLVLWVALGALVAFGVLVAFLATVGGSNSKSPLDGKPAPPLRGASLAGGRTISLSQFSGKWVLVNFAASWCVPCHQEMPQLLDFARSSPRYHATILTVAESSGDAANMRKFLASSHATWPAINNSTAPVSWGVIQVPTTFIVNPSGIVVDELTSGVNARAVDSAIANASDT
jgi:cytochrome c biogenesis protein CcmG, thiol:disulfide interchange protein DsbE